MEQAFAVTALREQTQFNVDAAENRRYQRRR